MLTAGRYQLPLKWGLLENGAYRVQIEGYRKTGRKERNRTNPEAPSVDVLEQFIPESYNSRSTLTVRVAELPDGSKLDFHLDEAK